MSRELAVLQSTYKLWVSPINFVCKCPPLVGWRCHFASPFSVVFELFSHTPALRYRCRPAGVRFLVHHATVPIPVVLLVVGSRNTRLYGIVRSAFKILNWPVSVTLSHAREWPISPTVRVSLQCENVGSLLNSETYFSSTCIPGEKHHVKARRCVICWQFGSPSYLSKQKQNTTVNAYIHKSHCIYYRPIIRIWICSRPFFCYLAPIGEICSDASRQVQHSRQVAPEQGQYFFRSRRLKRMVGYQAMLSREKVGLWSTRLAG